MATSPATVEEIYRTESRRVFATLIRLLGDFDLQEYVGEGLQLVERALSTRRFGSYTLQAAIAAVHAESPSSDATDWAQIVALYDVLARWEPSPVIELNRAVAVSMYQGPDARLALIEDIFDRGELKDYHLAHSAKAELCRRLGKRTDARSAYERALALAQLEPERSFLEQRLRELGDVEPWLFPD